MKKKLIPLVLIISSLLTISHYSQEDQWYEIRFPVSIPDYSQCGVNSPIQYYSDFYQTIPLTAHNVEDGSLQNVYWEAYQYFPDYDDTEVCTSIARLDDEGDCYDFLSGCHYHSKNDCSTDQGMGALFSDLMSDLTSFWGKTGREEKFAYKHSARAAGVVLFRARLQLREPGYFLENEVFHYDPTDPSRKTLIGKIAFVFRNGVKHWWGFETIPFQELPESEYYTRLRNPDESHPDSCAFFGTKKMNAQIEALAKAYYENKNRHVKISINDMSLKYGGVFDLHNNCSNPHWRHRTGESVDINRGPDLEVLKRIIKEQKINLKRIDESTIHIEYYEQES